MNPFKRLPGSRRYPAGLEWSVLKKLPLIFLVGMLIPALPLLMAFAGLLNLQQEAMRAMQFGIVGWWLFHAMSTLAVAILCVIVVVMKGHAYVADAYALPDSDRPQP